MLNNDKNIRYVALNTLLTVVSADYNAVQRHRATVLDCLKDPDVSIKKRAMELSFALINSQNIRTMVNDLLTFLETCELEFKSDCASNLAIAVERFSPNPQWHFDTVLKMLVLAGNSVREDVIASTIQLIAETPTLHQYSGVVFIRALQPGGPDLVTHQPLLQVAAWTIGEYGQKLVGQQDVDGEIVSVSETTLVAAIERIVNCRVLSVLTRGYGLTACAKLTARITDNEELARLSLLIQMYGPSTLIELQQRSIEYKQILNMSQQQRSALLEEMPVLEVNKPGIQMDDVPEETNGNLDLLGGRETTTTTTTTNGNNATNDVSFLVIFGN